MFFYKKGRWGYVDTNNNIVNPMDLKYDRVYRFFDGMARVRIKGKYGFIDITEKEVLKPKYIGVTDFNNGMAAATMKKTSGFLLAMLILWSFGQSEYGAELGNINRQMMIQNINTGGLRRSPAQSQTDQKNYASKIAD